DRPAVRLDDAAADREPEAQPAGLAALVGLDVRLEDALAVARIDPGPTVADRDLHHAPPALLDGTRADLERAARGRELERVAEQVHEHLLHARRIAARARRVVRERERDAQALLLEQRREAAHHAFHER